MVILMSRTSKAGTLHSFSYRFTSFQKFLKKSVQNEVALEFNGWAIGLIRIHSLTGLR